MTRVSTAEMYDDKDVITQICKLKDGLNSALGGIIADIDIVNDELVIDWADGESIALPLPSPTGISSIAGSVSGGNLTMTIYMTDGSSHAFTCPLTGFVTLDTVQTLTAKKIFSVSPEVPTTPATTVSAVNQDWAENVAYSDDTVNNILHKEGNERKIGKLELTGGLDIQGCWQNLTPTTVTDALLYSNDVNNADNQCGVLTSATTNAPTDLNQGYLMTFVFGTSRIYKVIIGFDNIDSSSAIWLNRFAYGAWGGWAKLKGVI